MAQKQTPWQSIDNNQLTILGNKAFDEISPDKNAKLQLFEYAVIYHQNKIIEKLQVLNFKPAKNPAKAMDILQKKYFLFYNSQNLTSVIRETDSYGVDFRNLFNLTPLMVASFMGNVTLIQHLVENGADISLTDNIGRNALLIALAQSYFNEKYATAKLSSVYRLLAPSSISIKVEGKLIKIDNHLMEFFMFNLIAAISPQKFTEKYFHYSPGFSTADFLDELKDFPDEVLLERRKKRSYISSILSKNEANRIGPYNRKIFIRTGHGLYILNPELEVKINNAWIRIYDLLKLKLSIDRYLLKQKRPHAETRAPDDVIKSVEKQEPIFSIPKEQFFEQEDFFENMDTN